VTPALCDRCLDEAKNVIAGPRLNGDRRHPVKAREIRKAQSMATARIPGVTARWQAMHGMSCECRLEFVGGSELSKP
jgi:hypothetical protein